MSPRRVCFSRAKIRQINGFVNIKSNLEKMNYSEAWHLDRIHSRRVEKFLLSQPRFYAEKTAVHSGENRSSPPRNFFEIREEPFYGSAFVGEEECIGRQESAWLLDFSSKIRSVMMMESIEIVLSLQKKNKE